jgi:hypothetical protein
VLSTKKDRGCAVDRKGQGKKFAALQPLHPSFDTTKQHNGAPSVQTTLPPSEGYEIISSAHSECSPQQPVFNDIGLSLSFALALAHMILYKGTYKGIATL